MDYDTLRMNTNRGWNTWNTASVLSFVHLPEGFAMNLVIREPRQSRVLRESLIGRLEAGEETIVPGPRTYDGRYAEMTLSYAGCEIRFRSAVKDDEQIILAEPLKRGFDWPELSVEACVLWGKEGSVALRGGRLTGTFDGRSFEVFTSCPTHRSVYTYAVSPSVSLTLSEPTVIASRPTTVEEALAILEENKAALDAENSAWGSHSEAYTAMKTCLAWDTVYEQEHDRVCSPVSRIWNINWGGYVLFDWDTYFSALMASLENKDLAFLNAAAITDEVTSAGFVPNFGAAHSDKSSTRSQPPVGAAVCMDIYRRHPEPWFLEKVFPTLLGWNEWFAANRTTPEGYMCWGCSRLPEKTGWRWDDDDDSLQCARFESGLDNSSMYDDVSFDDETGMMALADVGLMGLYISDCAALAAMAEVVGRGEEVPAILARKEKVEEALLTLWDEEFGMFLNKDLRTGELSRRMSATNFYALSCGKVTEAQKRRMMDGHFYNPEEFWGDWILPMTPRNDPAYGDQTYWRGRIWAPTNYLAYRAMKEAGLEKECRDLAEKSEQLILKEWRLMGHVHENYNGSTGMGCDVTNSDRFYHWGGLLAYIALDNAKEEA